MSNMSGNSTVTSGLSRSQKDIDSLLENYILGRPSPETKKIPIGTKTHPAYAPADFGLLSKGATPLQGQAIGTKTHPAYSDPVNAPSPIFDMLQKQLTNFNPNAGVPTQIDQLQSALSGKPSMNFSPLSPEQGVGPTNLSSSYNYSPTAVKSTLDNTNFTNDYFNKSVMTPLLRQYDTSISPRIADAAAANGNTFSSRTNVARQNALQDLNTQATAQLASAARQDNIERSQQDLAAAEYNQGQQQQSSQFGASLKSQLDTSAAQLNNQAGIANMQNRLGYDTLNTNTAAQLSENAANRKLQAVGMEGDVLNEPLNRAASIAQTGASVQQVKQQAIDRTNQEKMRLMPENNPYIKLMMAFLNRDPNAIVQPGALAGVNSGITTAANGMQLASMLGGSGAGAAAGSSWIPIGTSGGGLSAGAGASAADLAMASGDAAGADSLFSSLGTAAVAK
jgi:hypothetical protein